MTQVPSAPAPRNARAKLVLMLVTPLLVVGLATAVFYTGIGIPTSTVNKGALIQPPRQIDDIVLTTQDGAQWRYSDTHRGWGVIVTSGETCSADCQARITLTRQVRAALGKDATRVQRYLLRAADAPDTGLDAFLAEGHSDLQRLRAEPAALRGLLGSLGMQDPVGPGLIYIVDPRGFVMMSYLPSHPDRALLDDLRFLLRNSSD